MKASVKKVINYLLRPAGYRMTARGMRHLLADDYDEVRRLYNYSIDQIQSYYASFIDKRYTKSDKRTDLLRKLKGTEITESLYIISSLQNTILLDGDICEFGVAQGATSALIANEIYETGKKFWLFDSFEGLPKPTEKDILLDDISCFGSMDKYEGSMAVPVGSVIKKLKDVNFPEERVKIIAGFIEKTILENNLPRQVSFAYVDFDLYFPIKVALNFLDTVLVLNGEIIIDDYGFFSAGCQYAVDEFLKQAPDKYKLIKPADFAGYFVILKKIKN